MRRNADRRTDVRGLDRQFASAAIDEHGKLDAFRTPEIEKLVDGGPDAASRIEDVVDEDDPSAFDVEWQRRAARVGLEARQRIVVAIIRDVDETHRMRIGQPLAQPS